MTHNGVVLDTPVAVSFLEKVYPEGPWCLAAIKSNRQGIDTKTFFPKTKNEMVIWLNAYNGHRNLYWHVNLIIGELEEKASRNLIKSMNWLHVDIDARAGEDPEEEKARALGLLTNNLPEGIPPPTWVIFSGGGYQAGWKLEEPVLIDGEEEKFEDAKLYNLQLELEFRADNCHNVDRILRLPGTLNIPDTKKRQRGRVEILSELVSFNSDNIYPINSFTKASPIAQTVEMGQLTGDVKQVQDVSELDEWGVPSRVKVIMAQGKDPEHPKEGDNSRSGWVFDFLLPVGAL